jgi:transposase
MSQFIKTMVKTKSNKMLKNQKNAPINKNLIINSKYYIPHFTNEKEWNIVNILQPSWFNILSYNYKISISNTKTSNICSIDIGCKNFITLYGLDGYCYKIKSDYNIIDKILKSKKITHIKKDTKIKKLINDLHIISADFICKQYDIIYVGLVANKGNINSKLMTSIDDNLLKIISHKEFLDILKHYAFIYNKEIRIVEESYTSVQCGVCGEKNKFTRIYNIDDSERRKYTCIFCNNNFCRDLNASRNILIKNEYLFKN